MLLELRDAGDVHLVAPRAAAALDAVDLHARHVQPFGDAVGRGVDRRVLAQPRDRHPKGGHYTVSR